MKVCNRCRIEKEDSEFRIRTEKAGYKYLYSECRTCDKIRAKQYYDRHKNDPAFKEKNRQRQKAYAQSNVDEIKQRRKHPEYLKKHAEWELKRYRRMKDVIAAKMKAKRQTPQYKAMMKAYRDKNRKKIQSQEALTKKRYHEKHRDSVSDEYVIRKLTEQGVPRDQCTPEIIEMKRVKILNKRLRNAIAKLKKK